MSLIRLSMTLMVGEGAARALAVVTYAVIARSLGVQGFGVFSFAMGIGLIAMVASDMGQSSHLGRLISREGGEVTHHFARLVVNKTLIGLAGMAIVALAMTALGMQADVIKTTALMIAWAFLLGASEGARSVCRALEKMNWDAAITSGESVLRLLAVVVASVVGADVVGFAWAFVGEAVVASLVVFFVVNSRIRLIPSAGEWARSRGLLRDSVGLGLVSVATIGFYRIDQVFVLPLAGEVDSGLYGGAARIAFTVAVVAQLVALAAYPRLAAAHESPSRFARHMRSALSLAIGVSFVAGLVVFLLAEPLLVFMFGRPYAAAEGLLRVLMLAMVFNAAAAIARASVSALDREKIALPIIIVLVVLVSAANVLLVPTYGAIASAWISVAGEVLLAVLLLGVSWDHLRVGGANRSSEGA